MILASFRLKIIGLFNFYIYSKTILNTKIQMRVPRHTTGSLNCFLRHLFSFITFRKFYKSRKIKEQDKN